MQLSLFDTVYFKVRWRFRAATLDEAGRITGWTSQSFPAEDRNLFTEQAALAFKKRLETLRNYAGGFEMVPAKTENR